MKLRKFRLGLRTLKTALAVMICLAFFKLIAKDESDYTISATIAALYAIFSMRQDIEETVKLGKARVLGNALGGVIALFYSFLQQQMHHSFWVELIVVPLLIIILIIVSDAMGNNPGIIGASSTLLIIVLTIPKSRSI